MVVSNIKFAIKPDCYQLSTVRGYTMIIYLQLSSWQELLTIYCWVFLEQILSAISKQFLSHATNR